MTAPPSRKRPLADPYTPSNEKKQKQGDISDTLKELHNIAEGSKATAARIHQLLDLLLTSDVRTAELKRDLKIIRWQFDSDPNLVSKIKSVYRVPKPWETLVGPPEKMAVLALWESGHICFVVTQGSQDYGRAESGSGTLELSEELVAKLDDNFLEMILQKSSPAILKKIRAISPELSQCHLLGNRTPALLLKHCPNISLTQFKNLPARFCNQTLSAKDASFEVNKELLMHVSDYFSKMWNSPMKERTLRNIPLHEVEPKILKGCLDLLRLEVSDWMQENKEICNFEDIQTLVTLLQQLFFLKREEMRFRFDHMMANFLEDNRPKIVRSNSCLKILSQFYAFLKSSLKDCPQVQDKFLHLAQNRAYHISEESAEELIGLKHFEIAVENRENSDTVVALGKLLVKHKRTDEAIATFLDAAELLKKDFQTAPVIINRIFTYKELSRLYTLLGNRAESAKWKQVKDDYESSVGPYDHNPAFYMHPRNFSLGSSSSAFTLGTQSQGSQS